MIDSFIGLCKYEFRPFTLMNAEMAEMHELYWKTGPPFLDCLKLKEIVQHLFFYCFWYIFRWCVFILNTFWVSLVLSHTSHLFFKIFQIYLRSIKYSQCILESGIFRNSRKKKKKWFLHFSFGRFLLFETVFVFALSLSYCLVHCNHSKNVTINVCYRKWLRANRIWIIFKFRSHTIFVYFDFSVVVFLFIFHPQMCTCCRFIQQKQRQRH